MTCSLWSMCLALSSAALPFAASGLHGPQPHHSLEVAFVLPATTTRIQKISRQGHWLSASTSARFIRRVERRHRPGILRRRRKERWLVLAAGEDSSVDQGGQQEALGEEEEGEEEIYVPTEELLEDRSHVERIMANVAKLLPLVPATDGGVFKSAVSHHCALRTSNILRAMKFYSLLGMNEVVRFRAEAARCAFLEGAGMRIELIEVPASMQPPNKAADLSVDMRSTGLNHIAFDVGPAIEAEKLGDMKAFLSSLNRQSEDMFGMSVRLVVSPYEQRIGQDVVDLAFIMDADGVLLELIHRKFTLDTEMPQAW